MTRIQEHQVGPLRLHLHDRFATVAGDGHVVAGALEHFREELPHDRLVVDYQDPGHGWFALPMRTPP